MFLILSRIIFATSKTLGVLKATTVYFFVLLYAIAMLRPIAPFVEYAINYDYIAKVLCINKDKPELNCNGKCQLMMELEKQQDDDYKALRISMEEYPVGFVTILNLETSVYLPEPSTNKFNYKGNYTYLFDGTIFHPPII